MLYDALLQIVHIIYHTCQFTNLIYYEILKQIYFEKGIHIGGNGKLGWITNFLVSFLLWAGQSSLINMFVITL